MAGQAANINFDVQVGNSGDAGFGASGFGGFSDGLGGGFGDFGGGITPPAISPAIAGSAGHRVGLGACEDFQGPMSIWVCLQLQ